MPHISVHTLKQPDLDKKRELVKKITDVVAEVYGVPREAVSIEIMENEPQNISRGGTLIADREH